MGSGDHGRTIISSLGAEGPFSLAGLEVDAVEPLPPVSGEDEALRGDRGRGKEGEVPVLVGPFWIQSGRFHRYDFIPIVAYHSNAIPCCDGAGYRIVYFHFTFLHAVGRVDKIEETIATSEGRHAIHDGSGAVDIVASFHGPDLAAIAGFQRIEAVVIGTGEDERLLSLPDKEVGGSADFGLGFKLPPQLAGGGLETIEESVRTAKDNV